MEKGFQAPKKKTPDFIHNQPFDIVILFAFKFDASRNFGLVSLDNFCNWRV
jgi:hypothetical protein